MTQLISKLPEAGYLHYIWVMGKRVQLHSQGRYTGSGNEFIVMAKLPWKEMTRFRSEKRDLDRVKYCSVRNTTSMTYCDVSREPSPKDIKGGKGRARERERDQSCIL